MATNLTNFYERGTDLGDIYLGITETEDLVLNRSLSTDRLSDIGFERLTCYTLWGWGNDSFKTLGIDHSSVSNPVIVTTENCVWRSVSVGGANGLAPTSTHVSALKCDGTIWSWGDNSSGKLGDGTTITRYTPAQEVSQNTSWCDVHAGQDHTSALKSNGEIWSWGVNSCGQLGNESATLSFSSPVREITSSITWCRVSTTANHVMAIKTDGTLWGWGRNALGQLANGGTVTTSSPVQEFTSSSTWCAVSAGTSHTISLKSDGSLWGAGGNIFGEIGDGTTTQSTSLVRESTSATNWKSISAGSFASAAVKTDCTLYMWGVNGDGGLGDGTVVDKCVPTQEVTQSQNWSLASVGKSGHTAAIKTDGTLWSWGRNDAGEIGNGTLTYTSSPVQESKGIDTWIAVSAGSCNTIGLKK